MYIGFIVGIIVASAFIVAGGVATIFAKVTNKRNRWAVWMIVFGVGALISAAVNYHLFY